MSYNNYIIHIVKAGERWDDLAYKYYGDCFKIAPIIMNNPAMPINPFLPAGEKITVPVYENSASDNEELPIWKQ